MCYTSASLIKVGYLRLKCLLFHTSYSCSLWYQLSILHLYSGTVSMTCPYMKTAEEMLSYRLQIPTDCGRRVVSCCIGLDCWSWSWPLGDQQMSPKWYWKQSPHHYSFIQLCSPSLSNWQMKMQSWCITASATRSLPPSPEHQQPLHWSLRVLLIRYADSTDAPSPHISSQWCSQPFASALFLDVA